MASKKKLLQAAAGSAGGAGLNVEEVFSTYVYDGTGSTQTITNGIDLSGEGGMTWIKLRNSASNNELYDTERGATYSICSNTTNAAITRSTGLTSFNSNGFTVGSGTNVNANNYDVVSWTFRKAPKFFDVVTWTGSGGARTLSHNLGSTPGMIIVKDTSNAGENWTVYHRGVNVNSDNAPETDGIYLNLTNAAIDESGFWNDTAPTSTQFTVGANLNSSFGGGANYVAYLFAHNDGDGDFGPNGDADIIKCGSYNGQATVDLGFEPQWLLVKQTGATSSWRLVDNIRGWGMGDADLFMAPDRADAELTSQNWIDITPTGFKVTNSNANVAGVDMIYIAIRRGPMAVPESGTEVFAVATGNSGANPDLTSGFPVDFAILRENFSASQNTLAGSRLQGANRLKTPTTDAEAAESAFQWDFMDGWFDGSALDSGDISWMWKRAPSFCDVVAYTGDGVVGRTVSHNLGVAPEMIWVKRRDGLRDWYVYHSALGNTGRIKLNTTDAVATGFGDWGSTDPTSSVFSVGGGTNTNGNGNTYVAYLFASLDGVSKVGSFTSTGSDVSVDCGFSNGARFVMIKRTDAADNWWFWDTERGITSGADNRLALNTTTAAATGADNIDPYSAGFTITSGILGGAGNNFIFYAVA